MTEQEKKLSSRILESKFNPLDVIMILIDAHQCGSTDNRIHLIREEFDKRVLMTYKSHRPVFSHKIENILTSFFWQVCNPTIQKYLDEVETHIKQYPLFTEDDWVQEYDDWSFNLADHISELVNISHIWYENEEDEDCECES